MRLDFTLGNYSSEGKMLVTSYEASDLEYQGHFLDVVGRDGSIDFTDAYGKVAYEDRTWTIHAHFYGSLKERQEILAELLSAVNGRRLDCVLTTDQNHVLTGRWRVAYQEGNTKTDVEIIGRCNPYRHRDIFTATINAAGGVFINLPSGDMPVCPIIEVNRPSEVAYKGTTYHLEPGAYQIRDIWFEAGNNVLYVDTYPDGEGSMTWEDYADKTWDDVAGKTWTEIKWGDAPPQVPATWEDYAETTWDEISSKRWMELVNPAEPGDEFAVYIQYERRDF